MEKISHYEAGFDVIGISVETTNENDKAVDDINRLWQRFYADNVIDLIPNKSGAEIYAVYSDYEGDQTKPYRLTIGCKVLDTADIPANMNKVRVPGGNYAVYRATGEQPKALITIWKEIWESNLDRVFQADYEVYGPRFFEEGLHEVMVHIGVKQ